MNCSLGILQASGKVESNVNELRQFLTYEGRLINSWTVVMQREEVTVMPKCSGGGNVVVA
jgi:hypothetical protein